MTTPTGYTLDFSQITLVDLPRVGGKNASLGELFNALGPKGVPVLDGFATTAETYRRLLQENGLEARLRTLFADLDPEDLGQLEMIAQYRATVVLAFREVADALAAQVRLVEQRKAQEAQVAALQDALHLATLHYTIGLANYIEVLDAA